MADEWEYDRQAHYDQILGQTTGLLAQRGDEHAVALLIDVRSIDIIDTEEQIRTESYTEDWTGRPTTRTVYQRAALLDVDEHILTRFTEEVRAHIASALTYVAERNGELNVTYARVRATLPDVDGDWRATYSARLALERPSNQARREAGRADYPIEDMLTLGSAEEQRVYRALKRIQSNFPEHATIAIAPLPGVRLRAGHTWSPDVMVIGRGRALIIETDGPHHRRPIRYVDDRNRNLQWQRCGVPVIRIAVEDLKDDDALDNRLKEETVRHLSRTV